MGRHSTPDDEAEGASPVQAVFTPPRPGRHARADEGDGPPPLPGVPPAPSPIRRRIARGAQSNAADLALLRSRPDVRNRCIAAVIVPFVLYSAVLVLIDKVDVYLLWVWIPLVSAGVLAGAILDAAHRKAGVKR